MNSNTDYTGATMEQQRKFNLDDYETVEERIVKFWTQYPDGRIETGLISKEDNQYIFVSHLYRNSDVETLPFSSGYAQEVVGQGMVNKTSALENCETSAIGRALANAGFATKGKRASREEMSKVQRGAPAKTAAPKPERSADEATAVLMVAYELVAGATTPDELKAIWGANSDLLDLDHNDTTLRAYIMQRKDEVA